MERMLLGSPVMAICAKCEQPLKPDELVTARFGQLFHCRCVEQWQDDDNDDTLSPLPPE